MINITNKFIDDLYKYYLNIASKIHIESVLEDLKDYTKKFDKSEFLDNIIYVKEMFDTIFFIHKWSINFNNDFNIYVKYSTYILKLENNIKSLELAKNFFIIFGKKYLNDILRLYSSLAYNKFNNKEIFDKNIIYLFIDISKHKQNPFHITTIEVQSKFIKNFTKFLLINLFYIKY